MITGPRFTALLLLVTGGLLLTAVRFRSYQEPEHDSLEGIYDDYGEDLGGANGGYNYCQAQRPSVRTYPSPKVRTPYTQPCMRSQKQRQAETRIHS